MRFSVVVFNPVSGRIHWTETQTNAEELGQSVPKHLAWMKVPNVDLVDVNADYVKNGVIIKRPIMGVTWSYDEVAREIRVENIPVGATVTVRNWRGVVNDGFIVWLVAEPGFYRIFIEPFPYLDEWIHAEIT